MNEKLLLNNPNKELLQLVNVTFEPFDAFFGTTTITSDYFDPIIYYKGIYLMKKKTKANTITISTYYL